MHWVAEEGAADFLRISDSGADFLGIHIGFRISERETAFPAFGFDLAAHDHVADGFGVRLLWLGGITQAHIDCTVKGVGHVLTRRRLNDKHRLSSQRLYLDRQEDARGNTVVQFLFQFRHGIRRGIHAKDTSPVIHPANEKTAGGVEEGAGNAPQASSVPD